MDKSLIARALINIYIGATSVELGCIIQLALGAVWPNCYYKLPFTRTN
jgi:hypothetical protein